VRRGLLDPEFCLGLLSFIEIFFFFFFFFVLSSCGLPIVFRVD
jgi:hypothetical protein